MAVTNPRYLPPRAAYVHVPFCRHRCGYCNFTLVAGRDDLIEAFLEALARELSWLAGPHPVDTLYIGGGTPTQLSLEPLERLLDLLRRCFPICDNTEFTVEANPADLSAEKVELLRCAGVNRISLGVQSFDAAKLAILERDHRRDHVERAVALARSALHTVSLDLIFAAPGESLECWQADLDQALRLRPHHLSTYGLTYERGTRFWSRLAQGELARVDETIEQQMYEMALDQLPAAGFEHYEISNFARAKRRCRHSEVYWTGRTYFGVGPGAAQHIDGCRQLNHRSTTTYLRRVLAGQSPVAESERLSPVASAHERLVFALRRRDGIERSSFAQETGCTVESLMRDKLGELVTLGLVQDTATRIRLTRAGILLCDSVCAQLLASSPSC